MLADVAASTESVSSGSAHVLPPEFDGSFQREPNLRPG
jgi:hypothetical protein